MAAMWDESCLDVSLSEYDINTVTRLQAVCRRWLVRKTLKDAQTEFQEIVSELDGPAVDVTWTESSLPLPVVHKVSKKTWLNKNQEQISDRKQRAESKSDNIKITKPLAEPERQNSADRMSVCVETNRVGEDNPQTVPTKPVSDKTQSDQEVQTEFSHTNQPQHVPEERQEEKHESDPQESLPVRDSVWPCEQPVHDTDNHPKTHFSQGQDSVEKDSINRRLEAMKDSSKDECYELADSHRGDTSVSSASHANTTSHTTLSHSSHVVATPDVSAVITRSAETSGQLKRVDSFFGDQTSVWDSSSSVVHDHETVSKRIHGQPADGQVPRSRGQLELGADMSEVMLRSLSTDELMKQQQNVAMELLWVQQAIISRKKGSGNNFDISSLICEKLLRDTPLT